MPAPKITGKDNRYFEIWTLGCGCQVRINTEGRQSIYRQSGVRAKLHADDKARLAKLQCYPCATCGHAVHTTALAPQQCKDCQIDRAYARSQQATS